jgi:hypothetical protein
VKVYKEPNDGITRKFVPSENIEVNGITLKKKTKYIF